MASARTENFLLASNGQGIEVRFAHQYLDVKREKDWLNKLIDSKDREYEVMILIPKRPDDSGQRPFVGPVSLVAKVWEAWCQLPGVNGQWSNTARWPILDCDAINLATGGGRPETEPYAKNNDWARGCWRINAKSKYPVRVFGPDNVDTPRDMLTNQFLQFKSGDFGLVSIHAYAYATGSGGVSFGIEMAKKLRDGDPIGGGQRSPEEVFGGVPAPASAPPLPQMAQPQPYMQASPSYGGTPGPGVPSYAPAVTAAAPQYAPPASAPPQPVWDGRQWVMPSAGGPPAPNFGNGAPAAPSQSYAPPNAATAPYGAPANGSAMGFPSNAPPPPPPQMGMPPVPPPPFGIR